MQTYQITIEPLSSFGTPLKGDTLFGHFCWQAAYDPSLLTGTLDEIIQDYLEKPFCVFSSAYPVIVGGGIALKRPDLPLEQIFDFSGMSRSDIVGRRKELKKRKWLACSATGALADMKQGRYLNDAELAAVAVPADALPAGCGQLAGISREDLMSHNSINRLTGTTGEGFAPFSQAASFYLPGVRLTFFAGIDETVLSENALTQAIQRIGSCGFGRDASTGMGKFHLIQCKAVDLAAYGAVEPNALYTLSPAVPETDSYSAGFFSPFTRFGRHGDQLAKSTVPFKNPVIMADEGAVLVPKDMVTTLSRPYIGTGLSGISKVMKETVMQGYSLYIPIRLEV